MKAAYIEHYGPPEVIKYGELPQPQPGDTEVLIRVGAVSVNPIDTYIRAGIVPMPIPKPYILGCDVAGTVEAVGAKVTRFKVGDRVWGSNQGLLGRQGTFAEYVVADECWLYPTPQTVSDREAAAIALVGITAHLGLFRDARLQAGETVFVHGGAGGVGSCVVQMAKAVGARVITTAGSDEKAELCRQLGADLVINYKKDNEEEEIRRFAPNGVNVWFETLREQNLEMAVSLLAMRGRLILMAGRESRPPFPVGPFYVKDCKAYGFAMFNAPPEEQRRAAEDINRWLAEGKLRPVIGKIFKLAEAAEAHRLQEDNTLRGAGTLVGKIVLEP
ncbi:NADPH:quinone reductase [Thermogutta sp.]|uniref:NADPH:quinone reductase n=1 Tax=Thermogutta sp. TaxID=1962930 RepID=UPI00321F9DDD